MSVFIPRPKASHNTVMPGTSGIFWTIPPYSRIGSGCDVTTIDLSGARTATAMNVRPRIITPSRTAWPPYEIFAVRLGGLEGLVTAEAVIGLRVSSSWRVAGAVETARPGPRYRGGAAHP